MNEINNNLNSECIADLFASLVITIRPFQSATMSEIPTTPGKIELSTLIDESYLTPKKNPKKSPRRKTRSLSIEFAGDSYLSPKNLKKVLVAPPAPRKKVRFSPILSFPPMSKKQIMTFEEYLSITSKI